MVMFSMEQGAEEGQNCRKETCPWGIKLDRWNFWIEHMLILWAYTHGELAGNWLIGIDVGAAPRADNAEASYPLRERAIVQANHRPTRRRRGETHVSAGLRAGRK